MTLTFDQWHKQKEQIDKIRREADKIEAEYQLAMEEVRKKDKVKTVKAAEVKYKKQIKIENKVYRLWVKRHKAFQKKHGKRLKK